MRTVSPDEMKALDRHTIEDIGIPSLVLMENAGRAVYEAVEAESWQRILVVSSTGNNGADGLVTARHLFDNGYDVELAVIGSLSGASAEFLKNYEILVNEGREPILDSKDASWQKKSYDVIVDALFGTGLSREIGGRHREVVNWINEQKGAFVVSIDIPSGLNGADGSIMGVCVAADLTVCFHALKTGMVDRTEFTGAVHVANIGIFDENIGMERKFQLSK